MGVKTGFADVNGTRLYYELAGSGDPMVLVHGNLGDRRYFDGQFEAFAERHRVLRYDLRGFGKSSLPVEGEAYRHVDDLKAILRHVGMPRAHILGISMGSAIAVDFVLTYPEMSDSLIPVGPWINGYTSPATKELLGVFEEFPSLLREEGARTVAEHMLNSPFYKFQMMGSTIRDSFMKIVCDYSFWHFSHKDPGRYIDPPAVGQLDRINLSTLIVTAEYDIKPCREMADLMEKTMPNAKKVDFPDATHAMFMEKPEEFNGVVLGFLNDIKGQ